MALKLASRLGIRLVQDSAPSFLVPLSQVNTDLQKRYINKHWLPKWKRLRRLKVIKVDLPNFRENVDEMSEEEMRSKLKEQGLLPPRPYTEKPFYISATGGVFEAYVPPEGDGKVSPIHVQGAKQKLQFLEKKSKTMMAIRKVRSFDEDFDTAVFCKHAQDIYIKMHKCMDEKDLDNLTTFVTERAYPEVIHNIENKTIRWRFIKDVELPRVVHARCTDVITKENIFGQITVRFHTQQSLAIYDRFGRLMYGSEIVAKDVLEYVVFEKHLANEYGIWRVHAKIIPDWLPPKEPSPNTFIKPKLQPTTPKKVEAETSTVAHKQIASSETTPTLAPA